MPIDLETFASGDTDYIAKMNSNVSDITDAINRLEYLLNSMAGTSVAAVGVFLDTLFNQADALIGPQSYAPTLSVSTPSTLIVAPGGMYLHADHTTVVQLIDVSLSFITKLPGTYYVKVGVTGVPVVDTTTGEGTIYSVDWSGSDLTNITYLVPVFYDTREANASRQSTALSGLQSPPDSPPDSPPEVFQAMTLDDRLERGESIALEALEKANAALGLGQELEAKGPIRTVTCRVDGTTGIKDIVQLDYDGIILGWSCIANAVGSLQVDVDVKAGTAPPAVPAIPNTTTDKISASAPIALASAQAAARDAAGVSTWTIHVAKWSTVQFNVTAVTTITRATLYLRIQEIVPVSSPMV